MNALIFYTFAILSVILAIGVVSLKRIMRAVLCLLGVLLLSAGFYLMLGSEFLAGVQVLVYIGGIVVLIVFAVMLTGASSPLEQNISIWRRTNALLTTLTFFLLSSWCLTNEFGWQLSDTAPGSTEPEVKAIGRLLLSGNGDSYLLAFEIISLLLLAVLIAAIVISQREKSHA